MKLNKINNDHYNLLYKIYGDSPQSLGWKGKSNLKRINHLICDLHLNDSSILDVGCGLAHLINYLKKTKYKSYLGIDINKKFISINKKRFKEPKYKFKNISLENFNCKKKFDYIIQNGMFNLKSNKNKYRYVEKCLRKMFYLCNNGISTNFLSSRAEIRHSKNFYYDPVKILKICSQITPNFIFKNNYFPLEFTVVLYKEKRINKDSYFINI